MQDDVKSLSHSKWGCKYHIVFAPMYKNRAGNRPTNRAGNRLNSNCYFTKCVI